jgi:hypothetical protein
MRASGTWSYGGKKYKLWRKDLYFTLFGKRYHYYKGACLAPAGIKWIPRVKKWDADWCENIFPVQGHWFDQKCYGFEWLFWQFVIGKEHKYD